jgi:hypothetical protein
MVYEFETPTENFLTINGEDAWPTDPDVPWNLRAAVQELGYTPENLLEIERKLVELGFDPLLGGLQLPSNPEDFFRGINDTGKLVDVRNLLAMPDSWLKNNLSINQRVKGFFTQRKLRYLFDDSIDQAPFVNFGDEMYVNTETVVNPETGFIENSGVAYSVKGESLSFAIDNPTSASNYRPAPVQALQRQIEQWSQFLEDSEAGPFIAQKIDEAQSLQERLSSVAEKFIQRKTAASASELQGLKLDKAIFDGTVSEFR